MIQINQFPLNSKPQMSSNRDWHGWPNGGGQPSSDDAWEDKKHWHGEEYNPYMDSRVYPDGTEMTYDPYIGTYSKSFWNGNHEAHVPDGYIHHTVGQRSTFTGDSHTQATGGNSDTTGGGHTRDNHGADSYSSTYGVAHSASGQGNVSFNPGNQVHAYGGSVMHSALNDKAAIGFGQGGQGQSHPNRMLMSSKGHWYVSDKGDMNHKAGQGNIAHEASKGNYKVNAKSGNYTVNGQNSYINGTTQVQLNGKGTMQVPPLKVMTGLTVMGGQTGGDTSAISGGGSGGGGSA